MTQMRIRHWKQRYDPQSKMVWAREMLFDGKTVKSGEEITEEHKALLGTNRLKKWWDNKIIQLWTIELDAESATDPDPEDLDPEDDSSEVEDTPEEDAESEDDAEDPEDLEGEEEAPESLEGE